MKFSKEWFGSRLDITINDKDIDASDIELCFSIMSDFEKKYSRFIKDNFLYKLNHSKSSPINDELFQMINICQKLSELTHGNFDITVLPLLENAWYWIHKNKLIEDIGYKNIILEKDYIELKNNISIDLWSIWKGYIVDRIYNLLSERYVDFIVNFGWDIRVKWTKKILLEDPRNEEKALWEIEISNISIASSSWEKRKTHTWNHLIKPSTKTSTSEILTLFVTHKLCSFADSFATALYVSPLSMSLEILNNTPWLEWMIITKSWEIYKSKGFSAQLYI